MDRSIMEKELKSMAHRLEVTLEIIMEHFRETEDRIEELEDAIEELKSGTRKTG
jgi:ferritin-like metal-binding protein YciE